MTNSCEQKPCVLGVILAGAFILFPLHYVEWGSGTLSCLGLLTIIAWLLSGIVWEWATMKISHYRREYQLVAEKKLCPDVREFSQRSILLKKRKWIWAHTYSACLFIISTIAIVVGFFVAHSDMKELNAVFAFAAPLMGLLFAIKGGVELLKHSRADAGNDPSKN